MFTKAIIISAKAHTGQVDKGGAPYILHPLTLMMKVKSEDEKIVALLHDVIEDTPITLDELREEGFSEEILEAVDLLTRKKGEQYWSYLAKLKENPLAKRVKIEDLKHNMDLSRISPITEKDLSRRDKYLEYFDFLTKGNVQLDDK